MGSGEDDDVLGSVDDTRQKQIYDGITTHSLVQPVPGDPAVQAMLFLELVPVLWDIASAYPYLRLPAAMILSDVTEEGVAAVKKLVKH